MNSNKRVVITGTVYNLLLNLLIIPEEEIERTLFITCDSIPITVRKNLKRKTNIPKMHQMGKWRMLFYFLRYRLLSFIFCTAMNSSRIYAQDHLPYMPLIVGRRHYAFTEDGPNVFKVNEKFKYVIDAWQHYESSRHSTSWKARLFDPIQGGIYARNSFCDEIVVSDVTNDNLPVYVQEKIVTVVDFAKEWEKSSYRKKQYILDVFNITNEDIKLMKSRKVVVFTQPFYEDGDVSSIEEHVDIYRKVMEGYNLNDVVIKTHPRETTDYKKYFPQVCVFNKPVPFQLLDLLGLKFSEAATVCSTAALSIPYPVKIKWVGARIHPNILKEYGDYIPEQLKNK